MIPFRLTWCPCQAGAALRDRGAHGGVQMASDSEGCVRGSGALGNDRPPSTAGGLPVLVADVVLALSGTAPDRALPMVLAGVATESPTLLTVLGDGGSREIGDADVWQGRLQTDADVACAASWAGVGGASVRRSVRAPTVPVLTGQRGAIAWMRSAWSGRPLTAEDLKYSHGRCIAIRADDAARLFGYGLQDAGSVKPALFAEITRQLARREDAWLATVVLRVIDKIISSRLPLYRVDDMRGCSLIAASSSIAVPGASRPASVDLKSLGARDEDRSVIRGPSQVLTWLRHEVGRMTDLASLGGELIGSLAISTADATTLFGFEAADVNAAKSKAPLALIANGHAPRPGLASEPPDDVSSASHVWTSQRVAQRRAELKGRPDATNVLANEAGIDVDEIKRQLDEWWSGERLTERQREIFAMTPKVHGQTQLLVSETGLSERTIQRRIARNTKQVKADMRARLAALTSSQIGTAPSPWPSKPTAKGRKSKGR